MSTTVRVLALNSESFISHRVNPTPPPDAEWLRLNESNRQVLSESHEAKRSALQRLLGLNKRDFSGFNMSPLQARPAEPDATGVPLPQWAAECIDAGEEDRVSEYLQEWHPGLAECDSFESLWGMHEEFNTLGARLDPAIKERILALGESDRVRYPVTTQAALKALEFTGWVLYSREEVDQLLAAFNAVRPSSDLDDDGRYSVMTWDSIATTMASPTHDHLALLIAV